MHAFAAAVRAYDFGLFDIGDVVLLGELLVAVFAVVDVLRHGATPANIIALFACARAHFRRRELAVPKFDCQT